MQKKTKHKKQKTNRRPQFVTLSHNYSKIVLNLLDTQLQIMGDVLLHMFAKDIEFGQIYSVNTIEYFAYIRPSMLRISTMKRHEILFH